MCGIFFVYKKNKSKLKYNRNYELAVKCTKHRGPDNTSYKYIKNSFLGHNRLSIIDTKLRSNQPFVFKNLSIIFNGEIFNYIELKKKLLKKGYKFSTSSDTEVLLKAYHLWGKKVFEKLNGMWSLVIFDSLKKKIIVSRDRFGIKPLFYFKDEDNYYFSSEINQLLKISKFKMDENYIQKFLKEIHFDKSNGETFFKDIFEFPKSHYAEIEGKKIKSQKYWDYSDISKKKKNKNSFKILIEDSVKIRARSDVPIGLLLSGGIDSSFVGYILKNKYKKFKSIDSFCYSSKDQLDESYYARKIAGDLGIKIKIISSNYTYKKYRKNLMEILFNLGQGNVSPSLVSMDLLLKEIKKKKVKVVLDGQGSDELLAGYTETYLGALILNNLLKLKLKSLYPMIMLMKKIGFKKVLIHFFRSILPNKVKSLLRYFYEFDFIFSKLLFLKKNKKNIFLENNIYKNKNFLNNILIDQHKNVLGSLLYYSDIVSMKHSIECRSPFLDHRLVDFIFSTDEKLKINDGQNKYALRLIDEYSIFNFNQERKKVGFHSPIKKFIKAKIILELKKSKLFDLKIFRKNIKNKLLSKLNKKDNDFFLFRLYQLHLWLRIFKKNLTL